MIPERYLNFLSEISGKFSIGNFGKLPHPIPSLDSFFFKRIVRAGLKKCLKKDNKYR